MGKKILPEVSDTSILSFYNQINIACSMVFFAEQKIYKARKDKNTAENLKEMFWS